MCRIEEDRIRSRFSEAFDTLRQVCVDLDESIDSFELEASRVRLGELEHQIYCIESFISDYVFGERDPEDDN